MVELDGFLGFVFLIFLSMSKNVRPLTALEVAKLSKPGLNALGGVPGLYLRILSGNGLKPGIESFHSLISLRMSDGWFIRPMPSRV